MSIDLTPHHQRLADEGYTIVEDAIEPELIEALLADVHRLEAKLGSRPADNRFEGNRTTRTYNLLGPRRGVATGSAPPGRARS